MRLRIENYGNTYWAAPDGGEDRLNIALLSSDDPQHLYLRRELERRFRLAVAIVEPGNAQQRKLWRRRRYLDWAARRYQTVRQRLSGRARYRARYFYTGEFTANTTIVVAVEDINSDQTIAALREARPHLTVVCGTTYISERVAGHGGLMINVHGGTLPEYKGNHGIFFAYANRDYERIGGTLHLLSPVLDGGDVIEVVRPEVFPHDNDEHLYCRSLDVTIAALLELLHEMEAQTRPLVARPQTLRGRTYRHRDRLPHLELSVWLRRRLGYRAVPHLRYRRHGTPPASRSSREGSSLVTDRPR